MEDEVQTFSPETNQKWLNEIDVARETKRTYCNGMKSFERFMVQRHLSCDDLREGDLLAFKHSIESRLAPDTVLTYLIGVRSFFRWLNAPEMSCAAARVKGMRKTREFKKDILTPMQASLMLDCVRGDSAIDMRNFAMLNLMLRTGLRSIEVIRADRGDIRTAAGCPVLYVHGKGRMSKDEFVVLTDAAFRPIERYLQTRSRVAASDPLFTSTSNRNNGGRLTTRTVSRIAKNAMRSIGLDDSQHTAHSLRHTAVTYALLGGAALEEAQTMARHASINTTMVYSHHIDRIKNAAENKIGNVLDGALTR